MSTKRPTKRQVVEVTSEYRCYLGRGRFCAFHDYECPRWAAAKCMGSNIAFKTKPKPRAKQYNPAGVPGKVEKP